MNSAKKYRKKPVVIEAMQWDGENHTEWVPEGAWRYGGPLVKDFQLCGMDEWPTVTLGDWIIKGVKGEFYPCKPEVFAATYEVVE